MAYILGCQLAFELLFFDSGLVRIKINEVNNNLCLLFYELHRDYDQW